MINMIVTAIAMMIAINVMTPFAMFVQYDYGKC